MTYEEDASSLRLAVARSHRMGKHYIGQCLCQAWAKFEALKMRIRGCADDALTVKRGKELGRKGGEEEAGRRGGQGHGGG